MKKNTCRVLTAVMAAAMLVNGCGLKGNTDADDDTKIEEREEKQDKEDLAALLNRNNESEESNKSDDEAADETKDQAETETADGASTEVSDQISSENSESDSLEESTGTELLEEGTEISFRGWYSNQGGDGFTTDGYTFISFDESDSDLNFDFLISLKNITKEQTEYINDNIYEEFEISFIYTKDMGEYDIYSVEPVSIKVVPEDIASAALYSADTDPLRGLVADDILDKYRATNAVKDPDSVYEEGKRLGHWVQKTIGKDGFPEEIRESGRHIGNANEFCFGTDVSNNFENNFPHYYAVYFGLKDYYTSDGTRSTGLYDSLVEDNEYLGNGDPKRIEELYETLKEFITACNNIVREK